MMTTKEMVEKTREWLGEEGIMFFTKEVLINESPNPWINLHFTIGMDVRNFLRSTHLCDGWYDHGLDNNWQKIIMKAITEDYTEEELE